MVETGFLTFPAACPPQQRLCEKCSLDLVLITKHDSVLDQLSTERHLAFSISAALDPVWISKLHFFHRFL